MAFDWVDLEPLGAASDPEGILSPQLASDSSGNIMAVWLQGEADSLSVFANYFDGDWNGEVLLDSLDGLADAPQVAGSGSENFIVVWTQDVGSNFYRVFSSRFIGGGWVMDGLDVENSLLDDGTEDVGLALDIASDGSGNFMVVWDEWSMIRVNSRLYSLGGGWSSQSVSFNSGFDNGFSPRVASAGAGNFMTVWLELVGGVFDVYASQYNGSWGSPERVDNLDTDAGGGSGLELQIADGSTGSYMALWVQSDGIEESIFASLY